VPRQQRQAVFPVHEGGFTPAVRTVAGDPGVHEDHERGVADEPSGVPIGGGHVIPECFPCEERFEPICRFDVALGEVLSAGQSPTQVLR